MLCEPGMSSASGSPELSTEGSETSMGLSVRTCASNGLVCAAHRGAGSSGNGRWPKCRVGVCVGPEEGRK